MRIGKWFSGLDLRRKVRFLFITAIALCVLFCFMLFYFILRNRMTTTVLDKGRNNLSSIGQNIETELENVNNISKLIMINDTITGYLKLINATNPTYSNAARTELYNILNSFSGNYSVYVFRNDREYVNTGIGVTNVDKEIVFGDTWIEPVRLRDGAYILIPNNKGAFTSNTDTNVITFVRIINDIYTQKPIGMLAINIPLSVFEQTYKSLADKDNHFAYLDSDGGIICADSKFEELANIDVSNPDLHQIIYGGTFQKQVISSIKVTNSDITLTCYTTVRIMEGITAEIAWSLIGIMLVTIICMTIINKYINKYITAPIHKLADSMSQVETGMLHRVSIHSNNDEIGILKDSYNEMLVKLNRLIEELIEQEKKRQKAEMEVLQEQIKPHFLYNTLDTIGYMSLQNTREEVYDAIETLGNFYRKFLSKGSKTIQLSDEIAIVKDYIKLQKLRYDDMFDDEYDIQPGLGKLLVPKLILQPLIENSIYHGIRLKGEKGIIRITVKSDHDFLYITVFDSGIGMSPERAKMLIHEDNHRHFGFKGTMDRIRYFYHEDDVFDIRSEEGKYCEIEIKIPLMEETNNVQSDDN